MSRSGVCRRENLKGTYWLRGGNLRICTPFGIRGNYAAKSGVVAFGFMQGVSGVLRHLRAKPLFAVPAGIKVAHSGAKWSHIWRNFLDGKHYGDSRAFICLNVANPGGAVGIAPENARKADGFGSGIFIGGNNPC